MDEAGRRLEGLTTRFYVESEVDATSAPFSINLDAKTILELLPMLSLS